MTIDVRRISGDEPMRFEVTVREGGGESRHRVTMTRQFCATLCGGKNSCEAGSRCAEGCAAQVIEAAFRFLLDREPKEAILGEFDITVIARYFAEFESALPEYLGRI